MQSEMQIQGRALTLTDTGEPVTYVPREAQGNASHPSCKRGVISSWNNHFVFVKYHDHGHSQATEAKDLIWG